MWPRRGSHGLIDSCILVQRCKVDKVSARAPFHLIPQMKWLRAGIIIICTLQEDRGFAQGCTVKRKYGWSLINPSIQCNIFYNICVILVSSVLEVLTWLLSPILAFFSNNFRIACLCNLIRPGRAILPCSTNPIVDSLGELFVLLLYLAPHVVFPLEAIIPSQIVFLFVSLLLH